MFVHQNCESKNEVLPWSRHCQAFAAKLVFVLFTPQQSTHKYPHITTMELRGLCLHQSSQHSKHLLVLSNKNIIRTTSQGVPISISELTSACPKHKNVELLHKHEDIEMVTTNTFLVLTAQWQYLRITFRTAKTHSLTPLFSHFLFL